MGAEGVSLAQAQEMINEAQRLINSAAKIADEKRAAATDLVSRGRRM